MLGESLAAVQRRAVQAEQRSDALDRSLALERVARIRLEASVRGLSATMRSETVYAEPGDRVRRATFDVRQEPYRVHADVALPRSDGRGSMDVRVELDTIGLELRLGCGARNEGGVRQAAATVVAPGWATVRLARVQQGPGVCADLRRDQAGAGRSLLFEIRRRFGVSVGYAVAREASGVMIAGPAVSVGFRVWP